MLICNINDHGKKPKVFRPDVHRQPRPKKIEGTVDQIRLAGIERDKNIY
jgi:hypothetical protein